MKQNKQLRHLDISNKFFEMGKALMKEGAETEDNIILQTGALMAFFSGIILDEFDLLKFGELCEMYSAKKILESIDLKELKKMSGYLNIERTKEEEELKKLIDGLVPKKRKKRNNNKGGDSPTENK